MISDSSTSVAGLSELLERVRRRIRVQSALRGTAETVSILIAGVLLSCGLDYLLSLPGLFRLVFLALTLLLTAIIAARRLIIPVLQVPPTDELGAAVDLEFPELQESVATLISIQQSNDGDDASTRLMQERLRLNVEEHIQVARPSDIVKSRSTIHRCAIAAGAIAVILAPILLWPSGSRLLAQRFVMPLANLAAASNFYFELPDGNRIVARNTDVELKAIPQWRDGIPGKTPTDVKLELRTESGIIDELPMLLNSEDQQFTAVLRSARESLRYRVYGGGAMTEWFQLTVGDPPVLQTATLTSVAPAYTRRAPATFEGASGDMEVLVGSQIEIRLAFNEPVHDVQIEWFNLKSETGVSSENNSPKKSTVSAQRFNPAELTPDGLSAVFRFEAQDGCDFSIIAFNKAGLGLTSETARRLIVRPDAPPTLSVGGIEDGLRVRPDAMLTVECGAADDIGIGALNMRYRLNPANEAVPQADLVDALTAEASLETTTVAAEPLKIGSRIVSHTFTLDLKSLNTKSGESLTVTLCTQDERPVPGPQVVCQGPWTIYIDDRAPLGGETPGAALKRKLLQNLQRHQEQIAKDQKDAEELKEEIESEQTEETQKKAEELSKQQKKTAEELKELAEKSEAEQMTPEQKEKLKELSEQLAEDAAEKLAEAANEKSKSEAAKKTDEAAQQLGKSKGGLERLADDIGTMDAPKRSGNNSQFDGQTPDATAPGGKRRVWGKLQDELDGENSDAGKNILDSEYADLIRRYRRDLARTGEPKPAPEQAPENPAPAPKK